MQKYNIMRITNVQNLTAVKYISNYEWWSEEFRILYTVTIKKQTYSTETKV
jgi:hypothetical protein